VNKLKRAYMFSITRHVVARNSLQLICCLVSNNVLPYQLNLISGQWSKICLYESLQANILLIYYLCPSNSKNFTLHSSA
jgi:hypothetical protein